MGRDSGIFADVDGLALVFDVFKTPRFHENGVEAHSKISGVQLPRFVVKDC